MSTPLPRKLFSCMGDIKKETKKISTRRLLISDLFLVIQGVEGQELRVGSIREFRKQQKQKIDEQRRRWEGN